MTAPEGHGASRAISHVGIVVPAYNEVKTIAATLREISAYFDAKPYGVSVIVAADGEDGTREVVAEMAEADRRLSFPVKLRSA